MAANKELFWLGVGVICIDGKDYGAGTPLPVSKIDKGNLKKMIGDGRIGGMIEKIEVGCKDCAGHLETIQAKNALIDGQKVAIKALKKELKEEVARLTSEPEEATKPAADTGGETGS